LAETLPEAERPREDIVKVGGGGRDSSFANANLYFSLSRLIPSAIERKKLDFALNVDEVAIAVE
jgi:hypothetical protein